LQGRLVTEFALRIRRRHRRAPDPPVPSMTIGRGSPHRNLTREAILRRLGFDRFRRRWLLNSSHSVVDVAGNAVHLAEDAGSPHDVGGSLHESSYVKCSGRLGPHGNHAVVRDQRGTAPYQRPDGLLAEVGRAARRVLGATNVAADVEGELVDAGGYGLVGNCEHRRVYWM